MLDGDKTNNGSVTPQNVDVSYSLLAIQGLSPEEINNVLESNSSKYPDTNFNIVFNDYDAEKKMLGDKGVDLTEEQYQQLAESYKQYTEQKFNGNTINIAFTTPKNWRQTDAFRELTTGKTNIPAERVQYAGENFRGEQIMSEQEVADNQGYIYEDTGDVDENGNPVYRKVPFDSYSAVEGILSALTPWEIFETLKDRIYDENNLSKEQREIADKFLDKNFYKYLPDKNNILELGYDENTGEPVWYKRDITKDVVRGQVRSIFGAKPMQNSWVTAMGKGFINDLLLVLPTEIGSLVESIDDIGDVIMGQKDDERGFGDIYGNRLQNLSSIIMARPSERAERGVLESGEGFALALGQLIGQLTQQALLPGIGRALGIGTAGSAHIGFWTGGLMMGDAFRQEALGLGLSDEDIAKMYFPIVGTTAMVEGLIGPNIIEKGMDGIFKKGEIRGIIKEWIEKSVKKKGVSSLKDLTAAERTEIYKGVVGDISKKMFNPQVLKNIFKSGMGEGLEEPVESFIDDAIYTLHDYGKKMSDTWVNNIFEYDEYAEEGAGLMGSWNPTAGYLGNYAENTLTSDKFVEFGLGFIGGAGMAGVHSIISKVKNRSYQDMTITQMIVDGKLDDIVKELKWLHSKGALGNPDLTIDGKVIPTNKRGTIKSANDIAYETMLGELNIINQLKEEYGLDSGRIIQAVGENMDLIGNGLNAAYQINKLGRIKKNIEDRYNNKEITKEEYDSKMKAVDRDIAKYKDMLSYNISPEDNGRSRAYNDRTTYESLKIEMLKDGYFDTKDEKIKSFRQKLNELGEKRKIAKEEMQKAQESNEKFVEEFSKLIGDVLKDFQGASDTKVSKAAKVRLEVLKNAVKDVLDNIQKGVFSDTSIKQIQSLISNELASIGDAMTKVLSSELGEEWEMAMMSMQTTGKEIDPFIKMASDVYTLTKDIADIDIKGGGYTIGTDAAVIQNELIGELENKLNELSERTLDDEQDKKDLLALKEEVEELNMFVSYAEAENRLYEKGKDYADNFDNNGYRKTKYGKEYYKIRKKANKVRQEYIDKIKEKSKELNDFFKKHKELRDDKEYLVAKMNGTKFQYLANKYKDNPEFKTLANIEKRMSGEDISKIEVEETGNDYPDHMSNILYGSLNDINNILDDLVQKAELDAADRSIKERTKKIKFLQIRHKLAGAAIKFVPQEILKNIDVTRINELMKDIIKYWKNGEGKSDDVDDLIIELEKELNKLESLLKSNIKKKDDILKIIKSVTDMYGVPDNTYLSAASSNIRYVYNKEGRLVSINEMSLREIKQLIEAMKKANDMRNMGYLQSILLEKIIGYYNTIFNIDSEDFAVYIDKIFGKREVGSVIAGEEQIATIKEGVAFLNNEELILPASSNDVKKKQLGRIFTIDGDGGGGKSMIVIPTILSIDSSINGNNSNVYVFAPSTELGNKVKSEIIKSKGKVTKVGDYNNLFKEETIKTLKGLKRRTIIIIDEASRLSEEDVKTLKEVTDSNKNIHIIAAADSQQSTVHSRGEIIASMNIPIQRYGQRGTVLTQKYRTGVFYISKVQDAIRINIRGAKTKSNIKYPNTKYNDNKKLGVKYSNNKEDIIKEWLEDTDGVLIVRTEEEAKILRNKYSSRASDIRPIYGSDSVQGLEFDNVYSIIEEDAGGTIGDLIYGRRDILTAMSRGKNYVVMLADGISEYSDYVYQYGDNKTEQQQKQEAKDFTKVRRIINEVAKGLGLKGKKKDRTEKQSKPQQKTLFDDEEGGEGWTFPDKEEKTDGEEIKTKDKEEGVNKEEVEEKDDLDKELDVLHTPQQAHKGHKTIGYKMSIAMRSKSGSREAYEKSGVIPILIGATKGNGSISNNDYFNINKNKTLSDRIKRVFKLTGKNKLVVRYEKFPKLYNTREGKYTTFNEALIVEDTKGNMIGVLPLPDNTSTHEYDDFLRELWDIARTNGEGVVGTMKIDADYRIGATLNPDFGKKYSFEELLKGLDDRGIKYEKDEDGNPIVRFEENDKGIKEWRLYVDYNNPLSGDSPYIVIKNGKSNPKVREKINKEFNDVKKKGKNIYKTIGYKTLLMNKSAVLNNGKISDEYSQWLELSNDNKFIRLKKDEKNSELDNLKNVLNKLYKDKKLFDYLPLNIKEYSKDKTKKILDLEKLGDAEIYVDIKPENVTLPSLKGKFEYSEGINKTSEQTEKEKKNYDSDSNIVRFLETDNSDEQDTESVEIAREYIKKVLGEKYADEFLSFEQYDGAGRYGMMDGMRMVLYTINGSDGVLNGVYRHEVVHVVLNNLVKESVSKRIINASKKQMVAEGIQSDVNDITDIEAEEWLAEVMRGVNSITTNIKSSNFLVRALDWLKRTIFGIKNNTELLLSFINDIESGKYSNKPVVTNSDNVRYLADDTTKKVGYGKMLRTFGDAKSFNMAQRIISYYLLDRSILNNSLDSNTNGLLEASEEVYKIMKYTSDKHNYVDKFNGLSGKDVSIDDTQNYVIYRLSDRKLFNSALDFLLKGYDISDDTVVETLEKNWNDNLSQDYKMALGTFTKLLINTTQRYEFKKVKGELRRVEIPGRLQFINFSKLKKHFIQASVNAKNRIQRDREDALFDGTSFLDIWFEELANIADKSLIEGNVSDTANDIFSFLHKFDRAVRKLHSRGIGDNVGYSELLSDDELEERGVIVDSYIEEKRLVARDILTALISQISGLSQVNFTQTTVETKDRDTIVTPNEYSERSELHIKNSIKHNMENIFMVDGAYRTNAKKAVDGSRGVEVREDGIYMDIDGNNKRVIVFGEKNNHDKQENTFTFEDGINLHDVINKLSYKIGLRLDHLVVSNLLKYDGISEWRNDNERYMAYGYNGIGNIASRSSGMRFYVSDGIAEIIGSTYFAIASGTLEDGDVYKDKLKSFMREYNWSLEYTTDEDGNTTDIISPIVLWSKIEGVAKFISNVRNEISGDFTYTPENTRTTNIQLASKLNDIASKLNADSDGTIMGDYIQGVRQGVMNNPDISPYVSDGVIINTALTFDVDFKDISYFLGTKSKYRGYDLRALKQPELIDNFIYGYFLKDLYSFKYDYGQTPNFRLPVGNFGDSKMFPVMTTNFKRSLGMLDAKGKLVITEKNINFYIWRQFQQYRRIQEISLDRWNKFYGNRYSGSTEDIYYAIRKEVSASNNKYSTEEFIKLLQSEGMTENIDYIVKDGKIELGKGASMNASDVYNWNNYKKLTDIIGNTDIEEHFKSYGDMSESNDDALVKEFAKARDKMFRARLDNLIEGIKKSGIAMPENVDKLKYGRYKYKNNNFFKLFMYAHHIASYNFDALFIGNESQFKSYEDYGKRGKVAVAGGSKFTLGMKHTLPYKSNVINVVDVTGEYTSLFENIGKGKGYEETDGMSLITPLQAILYVNSLGGKNGLFSYKDVTFKTFTSDSYSIEGKQKQNKTAKYVMDDDFLKNIPVRKRQALIKRMLIKNGDTSLYDKYLEVIDRIGNPDIDSDVSYMEVFYELAKEIEDNPELHDLHISEIHFASSNKQLQENINYIDILSDDFLSEDNYDNLLVSEQDNEYMYIQLNANSVVSPDSKAAAPTQLEAISGIGIQNSDRYEKIAEAKGEMLLREIDAFFKDVEKKGLERTLRDMSINNSSNILEASVIGELLSNYKVKNDLPYVEEELRKSLINIYNKGIRRKYRGGKFVQAPATFRRLYKGIDDLGNEVYYELKQVERDNLWDQVEEVKYSSVIFNDDVIIPAQVSVSYAIMPKVFKIEKGDVLNDILTVQKNGKSINVRSYLKKELGKDYSDVLKRRRALTAFFGGVEGLSQSGVWSNTTLEKKGFKTQHFLNYYDALLGALELYSTRMPIPTMSTAFSGEIVSFLDTETNMLVMSSDKNVIDGSDYDIDQLNAYFRHVGEIDGIPAPIASETYNEYDKKIETEEEAEILGKKVKVKKEIDRGELLRDVSDNMLENIIFDNFYSMLTDTRNKELLMQVVSTDELKALRGEVKGGRFNDFISQIDVTVANMLGKNMVGIFANGITKVSRLMNVMQNNPAMIPGFANGQYTPEDISNRAASVLNGVGKFLQASVDNPKDLILQYINANEVTGNIIVAMVMSDMSVQDIVNILTNDVIVEAVSNVSRSRGYDRKSQSLLSTIMTMIKDNTLKTDKDYTEELRKNKGKAYEYVIKKKLEDLNLLDEIDRFRFDDTEASVEEFKSLLEQLKITKEEYNEMNISAYMNSLQKEILSLQEKSKGLDEYIEKQRQTSEENLEALGVFEEYIYKAYWLSKFTPILNMYQDQKNDAWNIYNKKIKIEQALQRDLDSFIQGQGSDNTYIQKIADTKEGDNEYKITDQETIDNKINKIFRRVKLRNANITVMSDEGIESSVIKVLNNSGVKNLTVIARKNNAMTDKYGLEKRGDATKDFYGKDINVVEGEGYTKSSNIYNESKGVDLFIDIRGQKRSLYSIEDKNKRIAIDIHDKKPEDIINAINEAIDKRKQELQEEADSINATYNGEINIMIAGDSLHSLKQQPLSEKEEYLLLEGKSASIGDINTIVRNMTPIYNALSAFNTIIKKEKLFLHASPVGKAIESRVLELINQPYFKYKEQLYSFRASLTNATLSFFFEEYGKNNPEKVRIFTTDGKGLLNIDSNTSRSIYSPKELNLTDEYDREYFVKEFPNYFVNELALQDDISDNMLVKSLNVKNDYLVFKDSINMTAELLEKYREAFAKLKETHPDIATAIEYYALISYGFQHKKGGLRDVIGIDMYTEVSKYMKKFRSRFYSSKNKSKLIDNLAENIILTNESLIPYGNGYTEGVKFYKERQYTTKKVGGKDKKVMVMKYYMIDDNGIHNDIYINHTNRIKTFPYNRSVMSDIPVVRLKTADNFREFRDRGMTSQIYINGHSYYKDMVVRVSDREAKIIRVSDRSITLKDTGNSISDDIVRDNINKRIEALGILTDNISRIDLGEVSVIINNGYSTSKDFMEYKDGNIYINPNKFSTSMDIREFSMLTAAYMRANNIDLFNEILDKAEETGANDIDTVHRALKKSDDISMTLSIIETSLGGKIEGLMEKNVIANFAEEELEEGEDLKEKCKGGGRIKASKGIRTNFTKGGKWQIVKDLRGYKPHSKGGVQLNISGDGKVNVINGDSYIHAKYGMVIPNN